MNPTLTNSASLSAPVAAQVASVATATVPNLHEVNALMIVHVFAVLLLIGTTFFACAGAPETRKKVLMWSGIASLLVVVTGVRLWQVLFQFEAVWPIVKLVCWLGISAFAGLAYRRRAQAALWIFLTLALALTAVAMVILRPF